MSHRMDGGGLGRPLPWHGSAMRKQAEPRPEGPHARVSSSVSLTAFPAPFLPHRQDRAPRVECQAAGGLAPEPSQEGATPGSPPPTRVCVTQHRAMALWSQTSPIP